MRSPTCAPRCRTTGKCRWRLNWSAARALEAAGIEAHLPNTSLGVPAETAALFAWVLREGVTNVIRHSDAAACWVSLTDQTLTVADDGSGVPVPAGAGEGTVDLIGGSGLLGGNGLRGLRERAQAAGATLQVGASEHGGFLLTATQAMSEVIRLLLADDQAMVRGALATLLGLESDLDVVAQVGRGDEVLEAAQGADVQVALLDVEMPGLDGIAAAALLHERMPSCRSLIVTTFGRPGYLRRAMEAGASGFIVKDTPASQLVDAVRRVASGLRVVDPVLAAESLASGSSPLTVRETEVLLAAQKGGTISDIARELHLSQGTVRNHLSSAIGKTGARNRSDAASIASSQGWLLL